MHSYKEEITDTHDAFCIGASLKSALENLRDRGHFTATIEEALEEAYGYLAEGLSNCRCMFAGTTGEARIHFLTQFSDSALVSMVHGGYHNDSTGELMQITLEEFEEVQLYRIEKNNEWEATYLANEIVGEVNPVVSDTVSVPVYSLVVDGKKSEFGTYVTKWGICHAIVREFQSRGMDADNNTGAIAAILETIDAPAEIVLGDTVFSIIFEANN